LWQSYSFLLLYLYVAPWFVVLPSVSTPKLKFASIVPWAFFVVCRCALFTTATYFSLTGIKFRTCRIVPYHFGQWCFVICCFSFLLFFFLQQSSESERTSPNVVPPKHDEYVCYICIWNAFLISICILCFKYF